MRITIITLYSTSYRESNSRCFYISADNKEYKIIMDKPHNNKDQLFNSRGIINENIVLILEILTEHTL